MHVPDINEVAFKQQRVQRLLEQGGHQALILGRQDNFAWYTGGGDNRVVITSENGFGLLVMAHGTTWLVAHVMDCNRIMEEELAGLDVQPVPVRWYEESLLDRAMALVKGQSVLADIPAYGATYDPAAVYSLHYPLTASEIERYRALGREIEEVLASVARELEPGMLERDIQARILCECGRRAMTCDVLLVGSDERIARYRHPIPTDKRIEQRVLLHPAVRKGGLHANVTRMVCFGDSTPEVLSRAYNAACEVAANAIAMCVPGTRFADILDVQKRVYAQHGFADEWRNHFQGGITGYLLADPTLCTNAAATVSENQAFDWFITITGAKVEECSITTNGEPQVVSTTGLWPSRVHKVNGVAVTLPEILMK